MATIEATATAVVANRTNVRCWLFTSDKKRYSLTAKTRTHIRKMMVYFVFIKYRSFRGFATNYGDFKFNRRKGY
jgi:hypothetical protein